MRNICLILLLVLCGCSKSPSIPVLFKAGKGFARYEGEAYRWVNTDGPIELDSAWITGGVMTEEWLTADCSEIASLCIGGKAWIRDSKINGMSSLGDTARLYDSEFCGELAIGGELFSQGTTFHAPVTVCGDVTAERCCFEQLLTAKAEIIRLSNTDAACIYVEATGPYYDPQVIRLAKGSVVYGDIVFESGRGKIVMDNSSAICGCIYGGHIIKPFDCYTQLDCD